MAPRRRGQILPFRVPFFRIFYSTTYTILYAITLAILAITPVSMVWAAIQQEVYQYTFMIGGTYVLVLLIAIFIYSSRLYTNRTVLAGVGKAYVPIENGEIGNKPRRMIMKQLERSAIIAWESRPRDMFREIERAKEYGFIPLETTSVNRNDYIVGREIPLDPCRPPWGALEHAGWTSPAKNEDGEIPNLQFATVIGELPNLVEAKAVSLAPADPAMQPISGPPIADVAVVEALRRPEAMSMRDYLLQLSKLNVIQPPQVAQTFLMQYERARFCGQPITETDFHVLMSTFSELLAGMTELGSSLIQQIRSQGNNDVGSLLDDGSSPILPLLNIEVPPPISSEYQQSSSSPESSAHSPVTARTRPSRNTTPYMQQEELPSQESFSSVIRRTPEEDTISRRRSGRSADFDSSSLESFPSEAGSVVRHPVTGDG